MEDTRLLNSSYNDSNEDDISSPKAIIPQRSSKFQQRLAICRVVLDFLLVLFLGIVILQVTRRCNMVKSQCIQHHLPVGSDLSGFVPPGNFCLLFITITRVHES